MRDLLTTMTEVTVSLKDASGVYHLANMFGRLLWWNQEEERWQQPSWFQRWMLKRLGLI
jgi:hypothetical protein